MPTLSVLSAAVVADGVKAEVPLVELAVLDVAAPHAAGEAVETKVPTAAHIKSMSTTRPNFRPCLENNKSGCALARANRKISYEMSCFVEKCSLLV